MIESELDRGAVHPLSGGTIELADDGCFGSLISLVVVFDMTTISAKQHSLRLSMKSCNRPESALNSSALAEA